jgi:hypothetical protein
VITVNWEKYLDALSRWDVRRECFNKITLEQLHALDICPLQTQKLLYLGSCGKISWTNTPDVATFYVGPDYVDISYRGNQRIWVQKTTRPRGSVYWWTCPGCTRRMAILYDYKECWVCRICTGLFYPSQMTHAQKKTAVALQKIMDVKEQTGTLQKPKFMHPKTFLKLLAMGGPYTLEELALVIPLILKDKS